MTEPLNKQDIELLLPFYVNETLDSQETKQVEDALVNHSDLQEELVYLQSLKTQICQQAHGNSPGELGLKRLEKELQNSQHLNNNKQQLESLSRIKDRWKYGAMAACLMLVVLTITDMETNNIYQAAGGKVTTQHNGIIASVTFSPNVTEQEIRKLLLDAHVFIIDGPSAIGVYRLVVVEGGSHTIKKLAAQVELIESIQVE